MGWFDRLFGPSVILELLAGERYDDIRELASRDEEVIRKLLKELADWRLVGDVDSFYPGYQYFDVRARVMKALVRIERQRAIEGLIKVLNNPERILDASGMRGQAAYTLAYLDAVEPLIEALESKNAGVRRAAALALDVDVTGKVRTRAVEALIKALKDKDAIVRQHAVRTLSRIAGTKAVELLIEVLLEDSRAHVRRAAAKALSRIGDARAVEPLIEVLRRDNKADVRLAAAKALGEIGDPKALLALVYAAVDRKNQVQINDSPHFFPTTVAKEAKKAMEKIGEPTIEQVEPLIKALSNRYMSCEAAKLLGRARDPRAVEPLIELLGDNKADIRNAAAKALGDIGDPKTFEQVGPLVKALGDKNVCCEAAKLLGRIGDPRAVKPLIEALRNSGWSMQYWVTWALGKIGKSAVGPLIVALTDSDSDVREAAAKALGEIGDREALPELEQVARDDKVPSVAKAAREATRRISEQTK